MRVLGIVVARRGSKGIPNKNIRKINGIPLLGIVASSLVRARYVEKKICSTDSPEYAEIAKKFGLEVPFIRPDRLATDDSLVIETILDAVYRLRSEGNIFSHVLLLQPSSPTVTNRDIEDLIQLAKSGDFDTVTTAQEVPPKYAARNQFQATASSNVVVALGSFNAEEPRQNSPSYCAKAGLGYLFKIESLEKTGSLYGGSIGVLMVPPERAIMIDEPGDLERARRYFARRHDEEAGKFQEELL